MVAIVGDPIGDKIRLHGRYDQINLQAIAALLLPHLDCGTRVCLDVGANIGNHAIFFSRFFERVIAFEPNPLALKLLDLNLWLNGADNVAVEPVGLSDGKGTERLSVCRHNLGASRLKHLVEAGSTFADSIVEDVEVDLVLGDAVVAPEAPVGLIKIDVEGLESQALCGLTQTIERHRPAIVIEQLAAAFDDTAHRSPAAAFLADLGYRPFELRRIHRSRFKVLDDLMTILAGNIRHVLVPVTRFERRDYPSLWFLTDDIVARLGG